MLMAQMSSSWHHQGLFMGMHWLWWGFWILTVAVLGWAFWRAVREERSRGRERARRREAEEILRRRYGRGEVGEGEFLHRMELLRRSREG